PFILPMTIKVGFNENVRISDSKISYQLILDEEVPEYIHVSTKDSDSMSNQILYFSNLDENCVNGRQLLSMNPNTEENVELFLTKSQVTGNYANYLCIECSNSKSCTFNLKLEAASSCVLDLNTQYTYYVFSKENSKMKFTIKNEMMLPPDATITIWVKGSQQLLKTELNVTGANKNNFGQGEIYSFHPNSNSTEYYELIIEAKVGDLITVGNTGALDPSFCDLAIYPNSFETMGYLKKGFKEKECYDFVNPGGISDSDILFMSGTIFNEIGYSYFLNRSDTEVPYREGEIVDGNIREAISISELFPGNTVYFCITFNPHTDRYPIEELVYTFQLIDNNHYPGIPFRFPQTLGKIYSNFLAAGQLSIFSSVQPLIRPKEINYNMKSILGFPDMLFDECNTYPKCNYKEKKPDSIKNPRHANFMTMYSKYLQDTDFYSPISAKQPLLLVNCTDDSKEKSGEGQRQKVNLCLFETSIFSNEDIL
ncbi:MAG: hypothetical protein HUJ61_02390, partial [Bacilli bacterium]|nr:hypothetical protein [Bacilli bacterium]